MTYSRLGAPEDGVPLLDERLRGLAVVLGQPASPTRANAVAKRAVSPATRRSHASASDMPAPAAAPRTIAIVGFGISWSQRDTSIRERSACALSSRVVPPNSRPSAIAFTSPP